jgi:hypothetical protein
MNRPYVTLVKREFWEHRALWIAPLVAAGFFLVVGVFAAVFNSSFGSHIYVQAPMRLGQPGENLVLIGVMGLAQLFLVSFITCLSIC